MPPSSQNDILRTKLNLETAAIPWMELLRFFANGSVIQVSSDLDLLEVATCMSSDDTRTVGRWIDENRICRVSDSQAQIWVDEAVEVWTVVVKPWILVQERKPS